MFHLNQAALLSVLLRLMCPVLADMLKNFPGDLRDILVSSGDSVTLTCNKSTNKTIQIIWRKDTFLFAHSVLRNQTFSNFTSDRLRIDVGPPSELNISNAQHNDSGLYTCDVSHRRGQWIIMWNLTVVETPPEVVLWHFLYKILPGVGLLLFVITAAVCLHRWSSLKLRRAQTEGERKSTGLSTWKGSTQSMVSNELTGNSTETRDSYFNFTPDATMTVIRSVKLQSVSLCLMVAMFHLNQAALLSVLLRLMCPVLADMLKNFTDDLRDILVSSGDSVTLTCNKSTNKTTQIIWRKDTFIFTHSVLKNQTISNFTSDRLRIDVGPPSELNISNAQHNDSGLYTCDVTHRRGQWSIMWNLTVVETPPEVVLWHFLYKILPGVGSLLFVITAAVCLHRKRRAGTSKKRRCDHRTLTIAQFHVKLGGEHLQAAIPPQITAE
ncbi:neural cell adhesion molecule 1-like isoform X1 [Paralichthys olivaceus]|uniref:neural cell adhesion molecule 1-like isoform X1 n=1 Tax=Paralichthys olivaceus TaxID=8255 RepID=UPI003753E087